MPEKSPFLFDYTLIRELYLPVSISLGAKLSDTGSFNLIKYFRQSYFG